LFFASVQSDAVPAGDELVIREIENE